MKIQKLIKKIHKAIEKTPAIKSALAKTTNGVMTFQVGAKNKQAFRFFRDQFDGDIAADINHIYGIGGRMSVDLGPDTLKIDLYTDDGKYYLTHEMESEATAA